MVALPLRPKTVAPRIDALYSTLLPGPVAVVADVRVCVEGSNLVGCFNTALVKLPLASDAVPTTVPEMPSAETLAETTIVSGPLAGKVYFSVEGPLVA